MIVVQITCFQWLVQFLNAISEELSNFHLRHYVSGEAIWNQVNYRNINFLFFRPIFRYRMTKNNFNLYSIFRRKFSNLFHLGVCIFSSSFSFSRCWRWKHSLNLIEYHLTLVFFSFANYILCIYFLKRNLLSRTF